MLGEASVPLGGGALTGSVAPTLGPTDLGLPSGAQETCRFPKLEECAHFHYERVQLPKIDIGLKRDLEVSTHSHSGSTDTQYFPIQVTCRDECWLIQRSLDNFIMLDAQLHQCIYDRKVSRLPNLQEALRGRRRRCRSEGPHSSGEDSSDDIEHLEHTLSSYLSRVSSLIDNSLNCGPVLNWLQLDNRGHRLLVPHEDLRSINTPAVAAAYSVRRYVSQARDELSLEVGDMISVIDMAAPGESVWWRGKRGFQVGFFPQYCVHIIGDKVPRNVILPAPVVGSLAISPIKPVLRKHGKLITFFRSFILNRPSRRRLKQSGILKERVFGCDLGEHLLNSGHEIPMVLKCCTEFIESHGIVDGIYRLSGVTSNIQKLRHAFDEDRIPNLYTDDILQDIHSVASLLKMYFRELPNPLCTYQLYQSFVQAVQGCSASRNKQNDNQRLLKMREAVQKLPPPHYRTLEFLMRHLQLISSHGAGTGMTTRNLAIVWAPNLLRCEELEVGGVAALQGVGVQAVVTEFLVCYADLIFSEKVPVDNVFVGSQLDGESLDNKEEKKNRPKSLAISTPTKLITLEEARNKHLLNKDDGSYIEVGGGPKSLPKKYHTVIELPAGSRKRGLSKRTSPSGWRSFFSKSRNSSHGNLSKNRDISSPGIITMDKSVTESDLRNLRPVKSAESLTSGQSEPPTCEGDVLGPLHCLIKPSGHNRSVSHDSYFDNLQSSQNNSIGSLLDLSEIQLNFDLEESEMRIFSEDESLVSSPKVYKDGGRKLNQSRTDDYSSAANSTNPSPKKQPRVVLSPDSLSRKRSRLEDQFGDIQFIDCPTPENTTCLISTTALVHHETKHTQSAIFHAYQPHKKSPRNDNRHSLNLCSEKINLPKSLTEIDFKTCSNLSPSPGSPTYKPLHTSSTTTPEISPDFKPDAPNSPKNLTTINIIYKSPKKESIYETIEVNPEKALIPTTESSLPIQEATQPNFPNLEPTFDFHSISDSTTTLTPTKLELSLDCDQNIPKNPQTQNSPNLNSDNSKKSLISETENVQISTDSNSVTPTQNQISLDDLSDPKSSESYLSDTNLKIDKRKSSDAEFLDENSIYQQVKYFRRSVHEINSLLDLETLKKSKSSDELHPKTPKMSTTIPISNSINFSPQPQPILGVGMYQNLEESLDFSLSSKQTNTTLNLGVDMSDLPSNTKTDQFDPEMGVGHYENVDINKEKPKPLEISVEASNCEYFEQQPPKAGLDDSNCEFYENQPLKIGVDPSNCEFFDSLEGNIYENVQIEDAKVCLEDSNNSCSVKNLTEKFEVKKNYLPPCLRAKNAKNSTKTRSLDENAFSVEFGQLHRRKSLDERVSSFIKLTDSEKFTSDISGEIKKDLMFGDQKLNRERIEKYKEERRNFWREKYRSESFRQEKNTVLERLKHRTSKKDDFEVKTASPEVARVEIKPEIVQQQNSAHNLKTKTQSIKSKISDAKSKFEGAQPPVDAKKGPVVSKPELDTKKSTKMAEKSPIFDRKLQELSDILDDDETAILLRREADSGRQRRVEEGRRHTFDLVRERELDSPKRTSFEPRQTREKKCSTSYNIKDMKAIFESKSHQ